jgi:hypothetical protein
MPKFTSAKVLSDTLQTDTSSVEVRLPSDAKLAEYQQDKAFNYTQDLPESESLISQVYSWLMSILGDLLSNETTSNIVVIIAYLLFLGILFMLVNQYMKGNLSSMITNTNKTNSLQISAEQTDLSDDKLDQLIQQAVAEQRFADAICHLYRHTLRQLAASDYITWTKDKTNHDYLYELQSEQMKSLFRDVTYYYEYAEYGRFHIDETLFKAAQQQFQKLNKTITENS